MNPGIQAMTAHLARAARAVEDRSLDARVREVLHEQRQAELLARHRVHSSGMHPLFVRAWVVEEPK